MKTDFADSTNCTIYHITLTDRQAEVLLSIINPEDQTITDYYSQDVVEVYSQVMMAMQHGGFCNAHIRPEKREI